MARLAVPSLLLLLAVAHPAHGFSGDWLNKDYYGRTAVRHDLDWDWGRTWSSWSVNNQPVSTVLSSVLGSYKFTLPRVALHRGVTYYGAACRLRRVARQLLSRNPSKPIKVGAIGGSITWGQGVRFRGEADWFSTLSKWMITAFPTANITTRNGCTPGVPASYMILCLELSVDPDVDLVFVEFTVNNGHDPALYGNRVVVEMERLVRRLLALPGRPAVVLMHVPMHGMAAYPRGHPKNPDNEHWGTYYQTSEDALGSVTSYYDVQSLSLRSAMYDLAVRQARDGFLWEQAFVDHHPGNQGHKLMADLAVWTLQSTALGLLQVPYSEEDEQMAVAALPDPMYEGNTPPNSAMCLMGDLFRSLVQPSSSGWEWINEGTAEKPKPGYVATSPGARLRIELNTDRSGISDPQARVTVFFHHLRSYEHMGVASFSCVSGCSCAPLEVDGHHSERVSQLYLASLAVSQHPACVLEVQVLERTSSGEHKFKVAGLVVSERAGSRGIMDELARGNGEFGIREHNGDVMQITYTKEGHKGGSDAAARRQR